MIRVRVRFYATFRELTGKRHVDLEVAEGATIGDLLGRLLETWPDLTPFFFEPDGRASKRANLYVGGRATRFLPDGERTPLAAGQEVDAFPAVAGG